MIKKFFYTSIALSVFSITLAIILLGLTVYNTAFGPTEGITISIITVFLVFFPGILGTFLLEKSYTITSSHLIISDFFHLRKREIPFSTIRKMEIKLKGMEPYIFPINIKLILTGGKSVKIFFTFENQLNQFLLEIKKAQKSHSKNLPGSSR